MRGWLLVAGFVAVTAVVGAPAGADPSAARATRFAAHRGGALLWPENSLLAFRRAADLGADYLELDVHVTRDGALVVIHDPTLDRTTTATGPVRERTLAEVRAARLRDRDGAPTEERVPLLDEVVELARARGRGLLLEIKVDDRRERYPGVEEQVLAAVDRHAMAGATVIMAFEPPTWRRLRELRPDVEVAALFSGRTLQALGWTLAGAVDEARRAGVGVLGLHQGLVTPDGLAAVRAAGLRLGVWTVNDAAAIRRFVAMGVDVVISDRPDLVKDALGR